MKDNRLFDLECLVGGENLKHVYLQNFKKTSLPNPLQVSGKRTNIPGQLCSTKCAFRRHQSCLCLSVRSQFLITVNIVSTRPPISKLLAQAVSLYSGCRVPSSQMENSPNSRPLLTPWSKSYMFQLLLHILPESGGLHLAPTPASEHSPAQQTLDCGEETL